MHDDTFGQIVRLVSVGVLGVITYFLRRVINQLDAMETDIEELKIKVAIILDRDRRRRLQDYDREILGGSKD